MNYSDRKLRDLEQIKSPTALRLRYGRQTGRLTVQPVYGSYGERGQLGFGRSVDTEPTVCKPC